MNRRFPAPLTLGLLAAALNLAAADQVLFEATSPYHHVFVSDANGLRTLRFDDAMETRMSLADPLQGHFEYTEFFHMPLLWNPEVTNVLAIGLGGASTQRSFEHYHPATRIQTVEIDPIVAKVARQYFKYQETDRQKLHLMDGRVFLRRSSAKFDLIILDAYTHGRYGSSIPPHLVTKEFFELARSHLTTNGVVAYNVITTLRAWNNADMTGALYRTMKEVFPQVYWFKAKTSYNVVLIATVSPTPLDLAALRANADRMIAAKQITLPGFLDRLNCLQPRPPASQQRSTVLTDDFAPVEGLMRGEGETAK
jgi:spermidine synthase